MYETQEVLPVVAMNTVVGNSNCLSGAGWTEGGNCGKMMAVEDR